MIIKETKYGVNRAFSFDKLTGKYGASLSLAADDSNCKLSYIHQAGNLAGVIDKERKEIIDYLLRQSKGCVILNTTQEEVYNFLRETYKTYYAHAVPIGYYDKFQYHICIKNDINPNAYCKDPVVEKLVADSIDKVAIKKQLNTILKSKRRKNDYVDEFIKSL